MMDRLESIWTHIEDMRKTFVRSLFIVGVGFIFLLTCYQSVFNFLIPRSLEISQSELLTQNVQRIQVTNQTSTFQYFDLPSNSTLISTIEPNDQKSESSTFLLSPNQKVIYEHVIESPFLIMGPSEGMSLVFKACFWLSMAITSPLWGWVWLNFILPGLKDKERSLVLPFLLFSSLFLTLGIGFAFYVSLPLANQYLLMFNQSIGHNAWTLSHYINYVLMICLGHAIAAELCFMLIMVVHLRILPPDRLISIRRYVYVFVFILSALLTPPDILSQILLAIPLGGVYEISILYGKWRNRKARQFQLHSRFESN